MNVHEMKGAVHLLTCSRNDEGSCVGVSVILDDRESEEETLGDCVDDCELVEY
jgi:hypothetical protein